MRRPNRTPRARTPAVRHRAARDRTRASFAASTAATEPTAESAANADAILEHAYDDTESSYGTNAGDDLPVGLTNLVTTRGAGAGELDIMLRHVPELNGTPQKVAGLADDLAKGVALPGEVDAMVSFPVTVQ